MAQLDSVNGKQEKGVVQVMKLQDEFLMPTGTCLELVQGQE